MEGSTGPFLDVTERTGERAERRFPQRKRGPSLLSLPGFWAWGPKEGSGPGSRFPGHVAGESSAPRGHAASGTHRCHTCALNARGWLAKWSPRMCRQTPRILTFVPRLAVRGKQLHRGISLLLVPGTVPLASHVPCPAVLIPRAPLCSLAPSPFWRLILSPPAHLYPCLLRALVSAPQSGS